MKLPPTLTAVEIRKLFKVYLGITCCQPQIYYYIKRKGFPPPVKIGRPVRWVKSAVMRWFKEQNKKFK